MATTLAISRALLRKSMESASPVSNDQALEESGVRTERGVEPKTIRPPFWSTSERPRVTISWPKWPSSSEPWLRRPETREMRKRWSSVPPRKTTGPATRAATTGPA